MLIGHGNEGREGSFFGVGFLKNAESVYDNNCFIIRIKVFPGLSRITRKNHLL